MRKSEVNILVTIFLFSLPECEKMPENQYFGNDILISVTRILTLLETDSQTHGKINGNAAILPGITHNKKGSRSIELTALIKLKKTNYYVL